jgi:hypothetical protein
MTRTIELDVVDWNESRRASIPEVPVDMTVGELLKELEDSMSLSSTTTHHLIFDGQKLNRGQTLEEVNVETGDTLTVAPEVMAG